MKIWRSSQTASSYSSPYTLGGLFRLLLTVCVDERRCITPIVKHDATSKNFKAVVRCCDTPSRVTPDVTKRRVTNNHIHLTERMTAFPIHWKVYSVSIIHMVTVCQLTFVHYTHVKHTLLHFIGTAAVRWVAHALRSLAVTNQTNFQRSWRPCALIAHHII